MFRFESLTAFQGFYLFAVLVAFMFIFDQLNQKKMAKNLGARLAPFLTMSLSKNRRRWKRFAQMVVLALMLVALARPQMGQSTTEVKSEGIELMLAVDVSESMLAEDLRPSRLEQVKIEMSRLVEMLPGHKIGLIAFAGSASLMSPITNDPSALKMYIDALSTLSVSSQGTEFLAALSEAQSAFERGGTSEDSSTKVTRVILIASDGEDQEPGALDQAKKLTEKGYRIFTVAYGTEKGAPIPQRDQMGYLRGYKKDNKGQTILTTVNGKELKALAESGRGGFYFSSFGSNYLTNLVEDINKLEKTQFESQVATQYDEKFQVILIVAFVLGCLELILGERKLGYRLWKGRFEVPPA